MEFNAVFNSIWVILQWRVHLTMLSLSSFNQYSAQLINILSKPLSAPPHKHCRNNEQLYERNISCCNDYHQSLERILAEPRTEPATCFPVLYATDWALGLCLSTNKAFVEENLNMVQMRWFVFGRIKNILGKVENASSQHFLYYQKCFWKSPSWGLLKVRIMW